MHEQNKDWAELYGRPANFKVEMGGEVMWDYMSAVMRLDSRDQMPRVPDAVAAFIDAHSGRFEKGIERKRGFRDEPVPTTPLLGDFDQEAFKRWIFRYRRHIWTLLYGSIKAPS
jgi:hypothetical protein